MAYDVSAMTAYTIEMQTKLVTKSHFGAKTAALIAAAGILLTGVKSAEKIPIMDTDVQFQTGGTCGFSSAGTTTFSDRTVTIGKVKVNESLCPKTLEAKATQKKLQAGSRPDDIPFHEEYAQQKAAYTAEANETGIWQGDTGSGTANLNKYDGFIKQIDAAAGSIVATNGKKLTGTITSTTGAAALTGAGTLFNTELAIGDKVYGNVAGVQTLIGTILSITNDTAATLVANGAVAVTTQPGKSVKTTAYHFAAPIAAATGITVSNVISIVDGVWLSFPARLINKEDARVFLGWDVFQTYVKALKDANMFHYTADQVSGEITIPGTNYKLTAVHGLNGTNRIFGIRVSNMAMAVDLENEDEKFEIFYAKEADEVRYVNEFKLGVNVALPADVISFFLV
jgi:hypothetical protein